MADSDLIDAMHDEVYQLLLRHGVEDLTALTDAGKLCESLQRRFGGHDHYVPVSDKSTRNARIAADLRAGQKPKDVAAKHGVHLTTVVRAAKRVEAGDDGFGSPDWNLK